jgi:hypothetical protein
VKWLRRYLDAWMTPHQRAQRLLMTFLRDDQWHDYVHSGQFIIHSQFGHRYVLGPGQTITRLAMNSNGKWRPATSYCFVQAEGYEKVPSPDVTLAIALWLSCNEQEFLRTAAVLRPRKRFHRDINTKIGWL